MASTSVSSSAIPPKEKYDVFISFRGKDTRKNFTSHLHAALIRKKVETYIDYRLERGDEVGPALLKAIKESKISVIIFSENYTDSSWCLDELAYILECKERHGQHVIPIFYEVEPSHVRYQIESYKTAFVIHEQRYPDKVVKWKKALVDAANLSGFHSTSETVRDDYNLVEQVVGDVLAKLNRESSMDLTGLIGAESRIQKILLELDIIPGDVRIRCVVLWGMGGIGKTTLADAVFHGLSSQFEAHCFLPNVRERSGSKGVFPPQLYDLRNDLLQELLGDTSLTIRTRTIGAVYKEKLRRAKVLVVLDDVNDSSQLTFLVGEVPFGPGSRIIITTRDMQPVRKTLVVKDVADHDVKIYKVEKFNEVESFQLLHSKAPKHCTEDSEVLKKVAHYAAGIPLALDILSSSYYQCEGKEEFWDQLKKFPDDGLQKVYRVSYDGLNSNEREIFLDIACFHKWEELCEAKRILAACGLYPDDGIKKLIDMSLISIKDDCLWMHDVIQEMAWEIVREESPQNLGKRSRLHNGVDVCRVLKGNKGTAKVQSISDKNINKLTLDPQAFRRMDSLRFLMLQYIHLDGMENLEYLPDALRYLYWSNYPWQSLPSKFSPDNLVELHMPYSRLERLWGKSQNPEQLKRIDLRGSWHLVEVPDLSKSVNIEWVNLKGCASFVQVPSYFQKFTKLTHLDLSDCSKLSILPDLPSNIEFLDLSDTAIEELPSSVLSLEKLLKLNLDGCSSIKNFSSSPWKLKSLNYLHLRKTKIERVPLSSFLCMTGIISLDLRRCVRLVSLPADICKLKSLETLDLSGCYSFINFPEIAEPMEQLQYLYLSNTKIEELPSSVGNLVGLEILDLSDSTSLQQLPSSVGNLVGLEILDLSDCTSLQELPSSVGNLVGLIKLDLSYCTSLQELPSSVGNLVGLEILDLSGCTSLELLPNSFCNLNLLEQLSLCGCVELKELPPSLTLCSLTYLDLSGCELLEEIPDSSTSFPALEYLDLSKTMIEIVPPSIKQVSGLKYLKVKECKRLQSLPVLPCHLENLDARECTRLETVSVSVTAHTQGLDQMLSSKTHETREKHSFGGCVNLDGISRSHIMDDAYFRIMRMATACKHWLNRVSAVSVKVVVMCPGNDIPKKFGFQTEEGSSLNIKLPQHWSDDTNFLGIALCSVSANPAQSLYLEFRCEMSLKTSHGQTHSVTFQTVLDGISVETDHVVVWYDHVAFPLLSDETDPFAEASFDFYTEGFDGRLRNVKMCGVCFLYAQAQEDDDDDVQEDDDDDDAQEEDDDDDVQEDDDDTQEDDDDDDAQEEDDDDDTQEDDDVQEDDDDDVQEDDDDAQEDDDDDDAQEEDDDDDTQEDDDVQEDDDDDVQEDDDALKSPDQVTTTTKRRRRF